MTQGPGSNPLVLVVLGTRPEAIKLAPVILALRRVVWTLVVTTGQHRELAREALGLFAIVPDVDLDLMRRRQSLDHVVARTLDGMHRVFETHGPRAVMIQGDTSSAMATSLSAFHHRVPIAHVEAGLRSHDLTRPYPEEMNRRAISVMARWHFAPTASAVENLRSEGVTGGVLQVGNTVVDAMRVLATRQAPKPPEIEHFLGHAPYIIATAHRRESWGEGIRAIALALKDVLDGAPDLKLVVACHPNPTANRPLHRVLGGHPRALVTAALPYDVFLALLRGARLAITDSGGVQEEGPTLGVPVLVTRELTERPDGVAAGACIVVGSDRERISGEALALLGDGRRREFMGEAGRSLYGDGHASERIVRRLVRDLSLT